MLNILRALQPDLCVESVADIDLEALSARGIRGLIMDVDNTLVERNASALPADVRAWLRSATARRFRMCLVSNSIGSRRVASLADQWNIPSIAWAAKPRRQPFRRAMRMMGTVPQETAVIGDQMLTDVLGGRRMGLYIVLVKPLTGNDFVFTRPQRWVEYWLLGRSRHEGREQDR